MKKLYILLYMYTRILGISNIILTRCNTYTVVNQKVTFNYSILQVKFMLHTYVFTCYYEIMI